MDLVNHKPSLPAFTRGMLLTPIEYFELYADKVGALTIEINALEIWVEEPKTKTKTFMDKAKHTAADIRNLRFFTKNRRTQ